MMRLPLLLLVALLGAPHGAVAQDCNQPTLDLFDLSRRARNILVEINQSSAQYTEAIALYEEELPSDPGYFGFGFLFQTSDLGAFGVCAADGTRSLDLVRSRFGVRTRWVSADSKALFELTWLRATQALTRPGVERRPGQDGMMVEVPTSTAYLEENQRYFGARLRLNAWVDVTFGLLDLQGVQAGALGDQLSGGTTAAPGWRGYGRIVIPALSNLSGELVLGEDLERPESAIIALPVVLPYEIRGSAQLAWLGDEDRAVLRAGITDPWRILSADVGLETSSAVFRHARLRARYLTGPVARFPKREGRVGFGARFASFYTRWGVDAEVSRFSGRHFEDITNRSGVNGWAVHGTMVLHPPVGPFRTQLRMGGGRNRVDLLEHAAAFVDRDEFLADLAVTVGW